MATNRDQENRKPQRKRGRRQKQNSGAGHGRCTVCGNPLYEPGGYAKTGMCGPCVTGDASTVFP